MNKYAIFPELLRILGGCRHRPQSLWEYLLIRNIIEERGLIIIYMYAYTGYTHHMVCCAEYEWYIIRAE